MSDEKPEDVTGNKNKSVEIPEKMYEMIKLIMDEFPEFGYESVEEFVRSAIRDKFISEDLI